MKNNNETINENKELDINNLKFFEIDGEPYIQITNENQEKLLRYNQKYNRWIEIEFLNDSNYNVENKIIETLSSQYIEKLLYRR